MAALDATGNLVLTGDAKANDVEINYDTTAGAYLISGVNTTINGGTLAINLKSLLGSAFNGNVNVNLGGGNDVVVVTGASRNTAADLDGSINVDAGIGN